MDNKTDFFQKKMYNPRSFSRQKKSSKTWLWILTWLLLLLVIWLICWKFFGSENGIETDQNIRFSLWEEVYLQWEIKMDANITIHPYTIDDINYGKIWLRSQSWINLSDYAGFVQLTGIVEKFYQWNPIVNVIAISGSLAWTWDMNISFNEDGGEYIVWAWIQFLPSFFEEYVLLNEWENWEIRIQNIATEKEIVLNYFRCNPSDPNKNCKGLNETFANNNAQSFVTSEWDVYYKMSESQSRLNEWIKSRAASICQWSWEKLQKINNSEINLKQEWLIVTVSGDGMEKQMTCQILVDFNLPAKWKLQSLEIWEEVVASVESENDEENSLNTTWWSIIDGPISATSLDTNVPQFPVKEEWLIYNSSRWGYSLQFPSSNISYSVSSAKENFGRNDINCSFVINVIKYSEKENLEISPSVRIYECQWSIEKSWAPWIVVYPSGDKKFIVQMNDGAWNDFSRSLKFQKSTEE